MWSITQLRSIPAPPPPCAVAEFGCAPGFPSVFFDAGPDLHAEAPSNVSPAAARTLRLRNALPSVKNVISILLKTASPQSSPQPHSLYPLLPRVMLLLYLRKSPGSRCSLKAQTTLPARLQRSWKQAL